MGRDSARPSSGNLELLEMLFDFVDEIGGAGAVNDSVIEGEREGNYFRGFVFSLVRNELAVGGADKERPD